MDGEEITTRIVSGSFMLTAGTVVADFIGLIFSVIIARLLGPEGYGIWSLSLVYPSMIASLADFGLGSIIARYTALHSRDRDVYIWTGLIFKCLLGFLGAIAVYFFADAFAYILARPYIATYIRVLSIYTFSLTFLSVLGAIFNGLGRYKVSASINILQYTLRGFLTVPLIFMGFGVYGAVAACSITYTILSIVYFIVHTRYTKFAGLSKRYLEDMLKLSIPLYIASIGGIAVGPFVNTVLAQYVPDYDLGNYRVALNALSPVVALQGAISTTTLTSLPLLLNDGIGLKKRSEEVIFYSSTIFVALSLCYLSIITPTIYLFYGRAYAEAPIYATLYSLGIVLPAILGSFVIGSYFITVGVTKWNTITALLGQLTIIILATVSTPKYGVYGALLSQAVGSILTATAALYIARKYFNIEVDLRIELKTLIPAGLAYIITQMALRLLPDIAVNLVAKIVGIVGGLTLYSSMYLVLLPLFVDKSVIKSLIMLASSIELVGKVIKPLGKMYLKIVEFRCK